MEFLQIMTLSSKISFNINLSTLRPILDRMITQKSITHLVFKDSCRREKKQLQFHTEGETTTTIRCGIGRVNRNLFFGKLTFF